MPSLALAMLAVEQREDILIPRAFLAPLARNSTVETEPYLIARLEFLRIILRSFKQSTAVAAESSAAIVAPGDLGPPDRNPLCP